jgi:mannosyltransferase OCH1-like enzyme
MEIIYVCVILFMFVVLRCARTERFENTKSSNVLDVSNGQSKISKNVVFKDVMQTYHSPSGIPKKVDDNWKTYAHALNRRVFDDTECKDFLSKNFGQTSVAKFDQLYEGAHKADLFRYAWLYVNGGIYMDIKTILLKDINQIFDQDDLFYVVVTDPVYLQITQQQNHRIFNGIMATPPNNPIVLKMFQGAMTMNNRNDYIYNCEQGYKILQSFLKTPLQNGINKTGESTPDVFVMMESELDSIQHCAGVLDRYDSCMFVMNGNEKVLKIRYNDYPW